MAYILRIDSSSRQQESHSKRLADLVQENIALSNENIEILHRDVSTTAIEHIHQKTIESFYLEPSELTIQNKDSLTLSNQLISEIKGAETLIISSPIYNFGVPSALKAWVDQIVRINETFSYDGSSFNGLVPVKNAILCLSYGAEGYKPGGNLESMNFLEPYLKSLMNFIGIQKTVVYSIEGTTGDELFINQQYEKLIQEIKNDTSNMRKED